MYVTLQISSVNIYFDTVNVCHLGVRISRKDDQKVSRSVSNHLKSRDGIE